MFRFRVPIWGVLLAVLPFAMPANAFDANDPTIANEMAELFSSFCIDKFPDNAAIAELAESKKSQVMTPEQVQQFLQQDPGHGWYLQTQTGLYVITIEDPPYRTCALRRMTPAGIPTAKLYKATIDQYVASKNGKLSPAQNTRTKGPGISDISAYDSVMSDASGKIRESFMLILTNYHGQVPATFKADAGEGIGVEVRMVHQFAPQ
jgi:hypothetical protein